MVVIIINLFLVYDDPNLMVNEKKYLGVLILLLARIDIEIFFKLK